MAKKAAALQSFQKCDVQNLTIPSTIVEDTEDRGVSLEPSQGSEGEMERAGLVFVETENEKEGVLGLSDRIEVAVSPAR